VRIIIAISTAGDHTHIIRIKGVRIRAEQSVSKERIAFDSCSDLSSWLPMPPVPVHLLLGANAKNTDGGESFVGESFRFMVGWRGTYK